MFQKLLVPLDGSELAEVVLPYAQELAGRVGSELALIYVSESAEVAQHYIHRFYLQKIVEATKEGAEKTLGESVSKAMKIESAVLVGHAAEEIVGYVDKEDIDLVVMATHGRSGAERWALGSVAEKVVKATSCPVMLIRAKGARPDLREKGVLNKILVALDGSENSEAVVPCVVDLALKLKAEVVLLHVLHIGPDYGVQATEPLVLRADTKEYIDKVSVQFKEKGIRAKAVIRDLTAVTVAEEIIEFADEVCADMVAMSTHGRSGVGRWVFGSVTDRVLRGGNIPILVVRAPGACIE